MDSGTPAKGRTGLSLYANLLEPPAAASTAPGTISRAPVVFKQQGGDEARQDDASAQKQQISAAALRFQPTKRPQLAAQKPNHKITSAKVAPPPLPVPTQSSISVEALASAPRAQAKTSIADWTADGGDDDVNGFYEEKRQRGGRKRRKKNKEETHFAQNWDDIYDPTRPNNYEEYKHSDEKMREMREWKDRLYAHRMTRRRSLSSHSDDSYQARPQNQFAPPPSMSFAPPPESKVSPSPPSPPPPPPSVPAVDVPDDATGEDAYARRLRLSQQVQGVSAYSQPAVTISQPNLTVPPPSSTPPPPPPPPPPEANLLPAQAPPAPPEAPVDADSMISRAPVRYNLPAAPSELPKSEEELEHALAQEEEDEPDEVAEEEEPRSRRPGQKGFAERLMSKYGWTKGTGLGATNSGIINPLRVQVEKQKKKPDSEGGGFVGPGGRGKIIGGKKKGGDDTGKFGPMSEVVILYGMVDGMDLQTELGEGNLLQEIGEECGEKYGRVERVYVDPSVVSNAPVFIKFTSQLSALRAVNALEGRIFNGNTITAKFFDSDKFEKGVYS